MKVKYLIIRFSSIGDIVLTTPVIRGLKKQVKNAEIHYLTKKQYFPVIKANPYIDKIHILENSLNDTIKKLREEGFDYIIDLHRNLRTLIVKNRLRVMSFSINKINIEKWLIVNFRINRLPDRHIVDRYMDTLSVFDVKNDGKGLDYFIPEDEIIHEEQLPPGLQKGFIAFVIGAKHNTKKLPAEKIINICNAVKLPVALLGDRNDNEIANKIINAAQANTVNLCGRYTINQSVSVLRQSKLVITNDTGLMHIAAAFKMKIISVWGNTIPEFGMSPYMAHPDSRIFEIKDLSCRPCSKIGYKECPKKHFRCMNDLDENVIAGEINNLI